MSESVAATMTVLAWNVQGAVPPNGSKKRIHEQVEYIDARADRPDIIMLNEVTTVQWDRWRERLADVGYRDIVDTLDWAAELRESTVPPHQDYRHGHIRTTDHVNGNLTVVHEDSGAADLVRKPATIRYGPWETSTQRSNTNADAPRAALRG